MRARRPRETGPRRASLRAVALAAALAGCGPSADAARPDARVFGEQCTPGGSFALDGRAAVLGALNVHVDASGLVEVDTTAELLIALDIMQDGTRVAVTAEACSIDIPDVPISGQDQPIRFDVPDETVASVAGVVGAATLSSPSETCAEFTSETFTIVIGAILDPEATAPLPVAADDGSFAFCAPTADTRCDLAIGVNCACDQEADGRAGATLRASNVPAVDLDEVYVALRTRFSLAGEVFSSDLILGEIDATIEQSILGCSLASGAACNAGQVGAVKNLNPTITPQLGNPSTFRAVRVPDGTACADIIAQRDELFPR
jgi:hypothetical protein